MGLGRDEVDEESADETVVTGNQCAAGIPGMIANDPVGFRPLPSAPTDTIGNGAVRRLCHWCEQMVLVRVTDGKAPAGFFVEHASSHQGYRSGGDNRPGKPGRERR